MAKLTTEEFIKRAREVHGDKYDYSKVDCTRCLSPSEHALLVILQIYHYD